jgi:type II secretory pathway component PulF
MLHLTVFLATSSFHIGKSPWGLLVILALAGITYWFISRGRNRRRNRDRDDES